MRTLTIDTACLAERDKYIPSKFAAAMHAKCPKCQTGDMFANGVYNPSSQKMNKNCPHCNFQFEVEPGYFYVAMLVSYALNVALLVTAGVITSVVTGSHNPWLYLAILAGSALVMSPLNFRYSRVILLYWLTPGVHFEESRVKGDK